MTALDVVDESLVARLKPWPGTFLRQVFFVVGWAFPFVLLAVVLNILGVFQTVTDTPNAGLLVETASVMEPGNPWELFAYYPPLTYGLFGLLSLNPNSAFWAAMVGGVIATILLLEVFELLRQKHFRAPARVVTAGVFFLTPVLWYNAMFNLQGVLVAAFVGVGIAHMIRFVQWGSTYSGFMAGLLFAGAVASGLSAVIILVIAVVSIVGLTRVYKGYRGALPGTFTILLYPSVLFFVTMSAVSYVVHGNIIEFWRFPIYDLAGLNEPDPTPWGVSWLEMGGLVLPLIILFMLARNWRILVWAGWTVLMVIAAGLWYGWYTQNTFPTGSVFLFASLIAIILLPDMEKDTRLPWRVWAAIGLQFIIGWLVAFGFYLMNFT